MGARHQTRRSCWQNRATKELRSARRCWRKSKSITGASNRPAAGVPLESPAGAVSRWCACHGDDIHDPPAFAGGPGNARAPAAVGSSNGTSPVVVVSTNSAKSRNCRGSGGSAHMAYLAASAGPRLLGGRCATAGASARPTFSLIQLTMHFRSGRRPALPFSTFRCCKIHCRQG